MSLSRFRRGMCRSGGDRWPLWLALLGLAPPIAAQQPRLRAQVDTTQIYVGDQITLRLWVDHTEGWVVAWPDSLPVEPFEVVATRTAPAASGELGVRSSAAYLLTSFELGELDIPSVTITATSPAGEEVALVTDPFRIGVLSVGLDDSGEIREIKGPLALPLDVLAWALWALLALVLVGCLVYLIRRRRHRPVPEPVVAAVPSRPFHILALEALDALAASPLIEQGRVKEYHIRLSEIIRSYVEGQLTVAAMEMTTAEVVAGLEGAALGDELSQAFGSFLDQCDLVKFAKLRPFADDARGLLGVGRSLVERTSGGPPGAAGQHVADSDGPLLVASEEEE